MESWLFTNYGVILGICLGVAVVEVCFIYSASVVFTETQCQCTIVTFICWFDQFICCPQLLGMILSMGLCKSVHQEDYTKVPKYWRHTHMDVFCPPYLHGKTALSLFLHYTQCFQKTNLRFRIKVLGLCFWTTRAHSSFLTICKSSVIYLIESFQYNLNSPILWP